MNPDPEIIEILNRQTSAALGTLMDSGPYVSAIGYLYETGPNPGHPGYLYFLISELAQHTRNLKSNPAVSVLITAPLATDVPIHETHRMTLQGRADIVASYEEFQSLKERYLRRFPRSETFFQLSDFRFFKMTIHEIYWIGGFGKARVYR